jgi:transposase
MQMTKPNRYKLRLTLGHCILDGLIIKPNYGINIFTTKPLSSILAFAMPKTRPQDPKLDALLAQGTFYPHAQTVSDPLFRDSGGFFDARDALQVKYEMVRRVEVEGLSITQATQAFGFSRPSFYQTQAALHTQGLQGLLPQKRGPKGARKLTPEILTFLQETVRADGKMGARGLVQQIQERFGLTFHPRTLERALRRQKKKLA